MSKWTRSRAELIDIAAHLCHRGYTIPSVAETMAERHFTGKDRSGAARRLQPAIAAAFWRLYGGLTEKQATISDKATQLSREGWSPLFDQRDKGCFWRHHSGITVNCNGGFFPSYQAATLAAYESQTRAALLRHAA
jgi:hypothetical protein